VYEAFDATNKMQKWKSFHLHSSLISQAKYQQRLAILARVI